jgi:diacylglycerol O-acyltransferase / wax synthase
VAEHLTALDATFLELEEADESAHMHIGGIMVFDRPAGGRPPSLQRLAAHLEERLGALPRYRQRLSEPRTGGLSWPEWREDPTFEIAHNIQRAALPKPGGERELSEWSSRYFSQRLDRRRPLWEMVVVEGLEGGRWALASKTHHCMVDGVGSIDVGYVMLDAEPLRGRGGRLTGPKRTSGAADVGEHAEEPPAPGALGRIAQVAGSLILGETIQHAAQMGLHGALHPREALANARAAAEMILREELIGAPHTSLNDPIGTRRRLESLPVPLTEMREIKNGLGGTVNDVALTVTTGGLRALLESRGERLPERGLRAMVPMNVRAASEHLALGNKISSLFIDLPVLASDPIARYRETAERSLALKSDGRQAAGTTAVIELAGLAPPVIHASVAQALYARRLFNLTITNVPGPQQTLYCLGSALREIRPLVPLAGDHAVGVAVLSYDGTVCFGVVADPDSVPDLDVMLEGMDVTVRALLSAARESAGAAVG